MTEDAKPPKLTSKQERFCREYVIDLNGTQAAIRAGYSEDSARAIACENLTKPDIAARVAELMKERADKTDITAEKVLRELALLGFANMQDYMRGGGDGDPYLDFSQLTREQAAALQEVTVEDYTEGRGEDSRSVKRVKFKLADKRAALFDIGKHLGMFIDRKRVEGPDGGPVQVINLSREEFADIAKAIASQV